jgi:hypothetical protein
LKELKTQLANALLVVLTVAAVIAAAVNFQQQSRYQLPDDGVTWTEGEVAGQKVVRAVFVAPDGSGRRAGIKTGDILISINTVTVEKPAAVAMILARLGAWSKAEYLIQRSGVEFKAKVYVGEGVPEPAVYYQYFVGAAYLLIGLFVLARRFNAEKARHFYVLCLASFVLSTFHYTGKLNNFDKVIYWANLWAGLFAPTIFLHFCLSFPQRRAWLAGRRIIWVYLPAALIFGLFVGVGSGSIHLGSFSLTDIRWALDRIWVSAFGFIYLLGALALTLEHRRTEDPMVRQQLKWLRNGVVLGILPITVFYLIPYAMGVIPGPWMKMAVLSLPLIPLTWAYAIVRYRLIDVDVIFQQGYAYTLATLAVIGLFYSVFLSLQKYDDLSPSGMVALILIATFVFQPIRNWIQEVLDRQYFYKDRYDYRRTLMEFARELSSETDLEHLLNTVTDRLRRTLNISHMAFFLKREQHESFELVKSTRPMDRFTADGLDLAFLRQEADKPYLFFERTRNALDVISQELPPVVRRTIAELDLTYYVPCVVRGRTIAYLGLSRTEGGDFLSSDDMDLVISLSGYVAIAIENARLYSSLERKVEEFERLKEFSENIVESINVGILAADLDDRVESWNTQIERLTGIARERAVGRRLSELLPPELCRQLEGVKNENGVHHIYKFVLKPLRGTQPLNGNGAAGHPESVVNLAVAPLVSKDYKQIGRLVIFDDITERSDLERKLMQADKLSSIGLLAAGVAHEVNTPLAVISSYAQMLAKQVSGDEAKSKLLEKIAKQTFRASEIVNSLLNFSRVSPTEFEEVELNRVIRETLSLIEHQLKKARVEVTLELDEAMGTVRGNTGKLQQVFLNLFLNARDAMEGGGTLVVRSMADDELARIEVRDSGSGIAPEHLARIYDPFFTTKGSKKGTGLGLAVTYGIVKEHGGHIEAESRYGAGTRFVLDFPLVRKTVHA